MSEKIGKQYYSINRQIARIHTGMTVVYWLIEGGFLMAELVERRPLFKRAVLGNIMKLAWPAVLEQMLIMMGGIVVTMFLGRYGTDELEIGRAHV